MRPADAAAGWRSRHNGPGWRTDATGGPSGSIVYTTATRVDCASADRPPRSDGNRQLEEPHTHGSSRRTGIDRLRTPPGPDPQSCPTVRRRARPRPLAHRRRTPIRRAGRKELRLITRRMGARAFISTAVLGPPSSRSRPRAPPPAATPARTEAQQIIAIAKRQLGDHWRSGAIGPGSFDCSGLVLYAYRKAGDGRVLRYGHLRSARSLYAYFRKHGKASRTNPKPGDLVIWGRGIARRDLHRARQGHQHAHQRRPDPLTSTR